MIFTDGFLHADPHQGNLYVRKDPQSNRDQLVILDHGLYRKLDQDFRYNYAKVWMSLLFADMKALEKNCKAMNAGNKMYYFNYPAWLS